MFHVLPPDRDWPDDVEAIGQALAAGAMTPGEQAAVSLLVRLDLWARPMVRTFYWPRSRDDADDSTSMFVAWGSLVDALGDTVPCSSGEYETVRFAASLVDDLPWRLSRPDMNLRNAIVDAVCHAIGVTR